VVLLDQVVQVLRRAQLRVHGQQAIGFEWTQIAYQQEQNGTRTADDPGLRRGGAVRLPGAGRQVRELEAAALGRSDRADVPACLRQRAAGVGAEMRQPLGTAVFGGVLGVTGFGQPRSILYMNTVDRNR
jgi:hypothetical protein